MTETQNEIHVARNHKDRLFRMIFREKKELLSLYNAVNGTSYTNAEELEIVTLENAIYMNMKNDLAFIMDSYLTFMSISPLILQICRCGIYFILQKNCRGRLIIGICIATHSSRSRHRDF